MKIQFHKYQGTGNDFILIDNRLGILNGTETDYFQQICHRHFGIGADGVILLNPSAEFAFEMDYFNSDGQRSTMCGNGGRCMARFAVDLGIRPLGKLDFVAIDGKHEAVVTEEWVELKMTLPHGFKALESGDHWVNTGSPHFVRFVEADLASYPVFSEGRAIRQGWSTEGTNVNFVKQRPDGSYDVRTYERGVEDETLSCGTGVTAVAEVVSALVGKDGTVQLHTPGGLLQVRVNAGHEPWLIGPAKFVFKGEIDGPK